MDEHPSLQPFSSHHHQHHQHLHQPPSCHLQGPELGYASSRAGLDPLGEHGSLEEDPAAPFLMASPDGRRAGGRPDGEIGTGVHFPDNYGYCAIKREDVWGEAGGFEGAPEYVYSKGNGLKVNSDFHLMSHSGEGTAQKYRAGKPEVGVDRQASAFARSASDGQEYCRTNSTLSDGYAGRDEDYGSSCGSGEDQLQPADVEGPWFGGSPPGGPGGEQHSPLGVGSGTYHQKLVSFSDAFLSQRKGRFPTLPGEDSGGQVWEFGPGGSPRPDRSRQSCAFDPDPYLLPTSSSSPFHSSLASFPSPPASSSLASAVLSPPLTPRPPPSFSPAKVDSPAPHGGGDPLGALQVFASYHQPLPSVHAPGVIWKLPLMAHSFSPSSTGKVDCEGDLRLSHGDTASQDGRAPEKLLASILPPGVLCRPAIACLPPSYQLPAVPPQQSQAANRAEPLLVAQRAPNGSETIAPSQASQIYAGTTFPSILHSSRGQKKGHYTPRPLLNPARRGKGLYFNLSPPLHQEAADAGGPGGVLPCVNIGHEFQAELPPCALTEGGSARWVPEEEAPREQLLWKPRPDLEDSANLQDQVEKLLSVCSSSCLPGGGSNAELALHCLHHCEGDTMATLEMMLFSQPSPAGDYHYPGSDFWTNAEKSLFNSSLGTHGKEFSLIQKTVMTKSVLQCVEFFYLNKRLREKQEKQKPENQEGGPEQQTATTANSNPITRRLGQEEVLPVPSLAGFFPCKLCGKMFYKIKSRNAHMKIHRQPQEDWADRRLQHQLITQRSAADRLPTQVPFGSLPSSCLPGRTRNVDIVLNLLAGGNAIAPGGALDPGAMATAGGGGGAPNPQADRAQRQHGLPFYQSWGPFGPDSGAFFCNAEGKEDTGAAALGPKEPIKWQ